MVEHTNYFNSGDLQLLAKIKMRTYDEFSAVVPLNGREIYPWAEQYVQSTNGTKIIPARLESIITRSVGRGKSPILPSSENSDQIVRSSLSSSDVPPKIRADRKLLKEEIRRQEEVLYDRKKPFRGHRYELMTKKHGNCFEPRGPGRYSY